MSQVRSRYATIWEQLKKTHTCSVKADPKFHARIIKAVTKRKDNDVLFKLECAEAIKRYRLKTAISDTDPTLITFTLKRTYGVREL